jgi:hypothetical protein
MIRKIRAFGAFWYDFIIGDDWRVAFGVTLAFILTYVLGRTTTTAIWWIIPLVVAILLPASIYRVTGRKH